MKQIHYSSFSSWRLLTDSGERHFIPSSRRINKNRSSWKCLCEEICQLSFWRKIPQPSFPLVLPNLWRIHLSEEALTAYRTNKDYLCSILQYCSCGWGLGTDVALSRSPEEYALEENSGASVLSNGTSLGGGNELTSKESSTAVPWCTGGDWKYDDVDEWLAVGASWPIETGQDEPFWIVWYMSCDGWWYRCITNWQLDIFINHWISQDLQILIGRRYIRYMQEWDTIQSLNWMVQKTKI